MQKGLGIAALVVAIISMFIPFLGTWMTLVAGALAAFAYGPGIGLGIASIILSLFHIFFLSPLMWATRAMGMSEINTVAAATGADQQVALMPWILIGAQIAALVLLYMMHKRQRSGTASS